MDSRVGRISLAGGLVHNGGELGSWVNTGTLEGDGGIVFGVGGAEVLVAGAETEYMGGGVCGVNWSSDVLAGLPKPDSLVKMKHRNSQTYFPSFIQQNLVSAKNIAIHIDCQQGVEQKSPKDVCT